MWSCHVTWVHLVEGVLCVRRVRCVSYWGCVSVTCLAVTDRVCVCEMEGVSVSCGSVGYIFSHNSSRSQVTPVFSRTYFAFFPSPALPYTFLWVWPTNLSTTSPPEQSVSLSESFVFPLTQLGRDCRDYRLLVTVMCVCLCIHCFSYKQQVHI